LGHVNYTDPGLLRPGEGLGLGVGEG